MSAQVRYRVVDPDAEFVSPTPLMLLDYWRGKAVGGNLPALNSIELMDLYPIAAQILIRDAVGGGREFRTRYWGSALSKAMGEDTTGRLIGECYAPPMAATLLAFYQSVLREPGVYRVIGRLELVDDREHISFEGIQLPLADAAGRPAHIFGAWEFGYKLSPEDLEKIAQQSPSSD